MKKLGLLKEPDKEKRVCLLPAEVKKLLADRDLSVLFEPGLGQKINISDEDYIEVGAKPASEKEIYFQSDIILGINHSYTGQPVKDNAVFIGIYNFLFFKNRLDNYLQKKISVYSLDLLPRTTLAQSMDVLSSMASLAGYKAMIKAAELYGGGIPMFTTAAGTLKPAKVLVLGAGVAGLQAIATAKRLGAVVEAFDVRASAGEEVRSLGAKFIEVPGYREAENSGGYAVAQSEEYLRKQKALINQHVENASIVICTANIPGKKAPLLVEAQIVDKMNAGAVIIDIAAEQGGNCELTLNTETIVHNGVTIVGNSHLPSEIPVVASQLLSNNFYSFLKHLFKNEKTEDALLKGCKVIEGGALVHPLLKSNLKTAE